MIFWKRQTTMEKVEGSETARGYRKGEMMRQNTEDF